MELRNSGFTKDYADYEGITIVDNSLLLPEDQVFILSLFIQIYI